MHTTNYYNTFIEVAEDCPATQGEAPPEKGEIPSVASAHFRQLSESPYSKTSDDVVFQTHVIRRGLAKADLKAEREQFFAKGQACMRCSPLARRYGWGIHFDGNGRMAIYPLESGEYERLLRDKSVKHLKAMRSAKTR